MGNFIEHLARGRDEAASRVRGDEGVGGVGVGVEGELEEEGVGGAGVGEGSEVGAGEEEEGEGEVVWCEGEGHHAMEEGEGERVVVPRGGEGADHDVEGVVVGVGSDVGEEKGGVGEVLEVYGFGEKVVVGGVDGGVHHHLGVNLLERLR